MKLQSIVSSFFIFGMLLYSQPALAKLRVVTSTTDLKALVLDLAGDKVSVESICKGPQDPHHIRAKPSYMVRLSRADLLLAVGLELEVAWLPALIQGARNPRINPGRPGYLELSNAVSPIDVPVGSVDRSQGDIHPSGNPHYWLDPDNLKKMASLISSRLTELDGGNAGYYRAMLSRYLKRLDLSIARWKKLMAPYRGRKVVSYHATFNYFHRHFGLDAIAYVERRPGIPPAPAHLVGVIRKMRKEKAAIIFHETYYDQATSNMVAKRATARVLRLPASVGADREATDSISLIDTIVSRFAAAAGKSQ
jgi:zinc/manganese transport system substrate-binding protein